MILGQTRTPFDRPAAASGSFQPKLPHTGYISHIRPFPQVMNPMWAAKGMYRPPLPPRMGPVPLPDVPMPAPAAAPGAPVPAVAPQTPTPGGVSGFGFGSTGGVGGPMGHFHVDPYTVMRNGTLPGISPSGSNIRAGIRNAGARIQRSMPFQTAELPPPPPPPPPPTPAATHGFGRHGGMHRGGRGGRRGWFSRMIRPETVYEVQAQDTGCETYPPNIDGIRVTVCNGRVVRYEDAQGNVREPHNPDFAGAGQADFELGRWPHFRRFARYADPRYGFRHGMRHLDPRNVDPRYAARNAF